ncbi:ubiquinol-cytochrome C chaperone family protein [Chenggangzhangella methanolivorans]|uniref:ubiquinol-cytochrome C chaperone family protein n=1 Tax=Chenggangzhangella methanolivorans TaxID=1437009 RepID=UPI0021BD94C0|nr:ubiquinol-cytochrome C chaperone family protein [Chenggangzhangella methanolivorans]
MIFGLFRKRSPEDPSAGETVYAAIAAAARRPALYRDLGAPDTLPGRFETLVLHAALVTRLGRDPDPRARPLSQEIFDAMIAALEANVREIGVGDVTVPKRMKAMARAFYDGRGPMTRRSTRATRTRSRRRSGASSTAALRPTRGPPRLAVWAFEADAALAAQSVAELEAAGPAYPEVRETRK